MKHIHEMTQGEIGAFVQSHLKKYNIYLVLSGGSTVSIYSSGKYVSHDLDLINVYSVGRRVIRNAMQEIGFQEMGRYFKHPESIFIVEFPVGPLAVGMEPVKQIDEIELSTGILTIISPTDCVKDRLAAYFHWGDRQCLAQAILVAQDRKVDFLEIKRWSIAEGKLDEFTKIITNFPGFTDSLK
jgi:hypothetical protein